MPLNKQMMNDARYWFNFDDQDMIANRQGRMSQGQLETIQKDLRQGRYLSGFIGTVMVFSLIASLILFAKMLNLQWLAWIGIVLLTVVICLVLIRNLYGDNPKAKKQFHPIDSIQGQVRLYSQPRFRKGGGKIYRVRIDNRLTFHVGYEQWKCFEDGANYILYYSPQSFRILSLEKMPATVD